MDIDDIQPNNIQLPDPVASEQRSTVFFHSSIYSNIFDLNIVFRYLGNRMQSPSIGNRSNEHKCSKDRI